MIVTLLLALLPGCDLGPSYRDVEALDSIEAYEAFLVADPGNINKFAIEKRLEELYWERAMKSPDAAGFEAYLTRFPEGPNASKARSQVEVAAFSAAVRLGTIEALKGFLAANPKAEKWLKTKALGRIAVLEYGSITLATPAVVEINLAEDPAGPKDGWGVNVDVTNGGDKTFSYVGMTVEYLADDGTVLGARDYPLVAPSWTMPATELQQKPFAPKDTRTWAWTESKEKAPAGWNQKVNVTVNALTELAKP